MHRKTRRGAPKTSWGQGGKEGESVPEEVIPIKSLEGCWSWEKGVPRGTNASIYIDGNCCVFNRREGELGTIGISSYELRRVQIQKGMEC